MWNLNQTASEDGVDKTIVNKLNQLHPNLRETTEEVIQVAHVYVSAGISLDVAGRMAADTVLAHAVNMS